LAGKSEVMKVASKQLEATPVKPEVIKNQEALFIYIEESQVDSSLLDVKMPVVEYIEACQLEHA
jgi:PleD family two-component response regulator